MAEIDSSILLRGQPVVMPDPLNSLAKVSQIQGMQNQNRLVDLQFSEADRKQKRETGLSNAYAGAFDSATGRIDPSKLVSSLAQGGFGSEIPGVQKSLSDSQRAQFEASKAQVDQGLKHLEAIGQIMSGVKDQSSYDQARAQAAQLFGPEAATNLPATYDPNAVATNMQRAMGVKDQLLQKSKDLDYQLGLRRQTEVERNNQTQNAISQGQLGVAQGNLGLSRQRLAFDQAQPKGQYDAANGIIVDTRTGQSRPVTGPDGNPIQVPGKAPTEFQGKSATYGARAAAADKILTDLAGSYSPAAISSKNAVSGVPVIGDLLATGVNYRMGAKTQKAEQAQRDFVNAVLRQESGAAISNGEFDSARKQYFPQPGDSAQVIQQKADNRKIVIDGFKNNAGNAGKGIGAAPSAAPAGDGWSVVEVK